MIMRTKTLNLQDCAIKAENSHTRTFSGYASSFNNVDAYGDSIVPGAYTNTIENRSRPIKLQFNHEPGVIGKWSEITEDAAGLFVRGELTPDHRKAEDVYASLKHGAVDGLSIGYRVVDSENSNNINYLKQIDLVEISIVEQPADLQASVSEVKTLIDQAETIRDIEDLLRDQAGFSKKQAACLISRIKRLGDQDKKPGDSDYRHQKSEIEQLIHRIQQNRLK